MIPPAAPRLPDDVLARITTLPLKPAPMELIGRTIRLVPLDLDRDSDSLHAISNGSALGIGERSVSPYDSEEIIWRYMPAGPFANAAAMRAYLTPQVNAANGLCYCVVDNETGQPVGVANYINNVTEHLKIELGSIWYSPIVQRTPANTEATYLLLSRAFALGYRRVEWKCDARNERSRKAALRMGFRFEGIQDYHFIIKGRSRDTAWFRILDHEWADVKAHLEGLLK